MTCAVASSYVERLEALLPLQAEDGIQSAMAQFVVTDFREKSTSSIQRAFGHALQHWSTCQ